MGLKMRTWIVLSVLACAVGGAAVLFLKGRWFGSSDEAGHPLEPVWRAHSGGPSCVAFSPDGKYVVAGSMGLANEPFLFWRGEVKVWDMETRKESGSLILDQWVRGLSLSPDGKSLAVAMSSE